MTTPMVPVAVNEKKIPRFSLLAGIGGVVIYLLGSLPAVIIASIYKYAQLANNDALTDRQITNRVTDFVSSDTVLVFALMSSCTAFFIYAWLVSLIRGTGNIRKDFGLRFTPNALWFLLAGLGLQIVSICMTFPIQLIQQLNGGTSEEQQIVSDFRDSKGWAFYALILLIALVVPFIEELCFRGLFLRGVLKKVAPWLAILITGALFAAVHFSDPKVLLGATGLILVGLVSSALATYRGRLDASICLHIGFNFTTVLLLIFVK